MEIYTSCLKKFIPLPRYLENTRKKLMCRTLEIMKYASFTSSIKTTLTLSSSFREAYLRGATTTVRFNASSTLLTQNLNQSRKDKIRKTISERSKPSRSIAFPKSYLCKVRKAPEVSVEEVKYASSFLTVSFQKVYKICYLFAVVLLALFDTFSTAAS